MQGLAKEQEEKDELQQQRDSYAQQCARITTRETAAAKAAAEGVPDIVKASEDSCGPTYWVVQQTWPSGYQ